MTERMRQGSQDALHALRVLVERGYTLCVTCQQGIWTVSVDRVTRSGTDSIFYNDGGTLDACLLQIDLDKYPARAA